MCTVTWQQLPGGYRVLFNRDERITRAPGLPPIVSERDGIQALMPIDSQAGGSWLAVNSAGLSVCLINNYGAEQRRHREDAPSRGILVAELAFAADQQLAEQLLMSLEPTRFNPFDIFIFDAQGRVHCWRWDGKDFGQGTLSDNFAFSAGFDISGVVGNRRDLYHLWLKEGWDLLDYHRSHIPHAGSYSVCMHRADAGTQSMSEIRVEADSVQLTYWPGPPCQTAPLPTLKAPRNIS